MGIGLTSRRDFLAGLVSVALLPLLPGCMQRPPLRIAAHPWPGYELLFLARREGWLSEEQVRLVETSSATASLETLERGTADGACLTLDELLRARDNGLQLTAVLVFDVSAGADHILARPGISSVRQLAGKRIGVEQSALGALMLHLTLQAAGLDCRQVQVVPMTPDNHYQVWQTERLDAMVCYEPIASQMQAMGAHSIFDSRSLPGMIVDLLAVRTDLLDRYAAQLRSLTDAHFRAYHHLVHNPQDAAYKLAGRLNLSAVRMLDAYRGLQLPVVSANRRYLQGGKAQLMNTVQTLSPIMVQHGLLQQPASLKGLFDDRFLPAEDF
ncbi:MAG: ABC transporter substrate-binding protein [Geobacter sp.]